MHTQINPLSGIPDSAHSDHLKNSSSFFGGTGLFELRCTSVFSAASVVQGSNWLQGGMIIFYQATCSRLRQVNHRGLLSTDTEEALVSFTDSSRWSPPWRGPI